MPPLDLVFLGGGLSGALAAYRLATLRPEVRFILLEDGARLGGNHTWSFHETDLEPAELDWIDPFVVHRWPRYEVRLPRYRRVIEAGYRTIESARLHEVVMDRLGDRVVLGSRGRVRSPTVVETDSGERIEAGAIVDARGFEPNPALRLAFQKFHGQVLDFDEPIGLDHPILMDATVDQRDGYRFVYVLPFFETRALVEDTFYSSSPTLAEGGSGRAIADYAEEAGWRIARIVREERGVLPITLAGDFEAFWPRDSGVPRIGLRGGFFHHTTGYSLPDAVRTADRLAAVKSFEAAPLHATLRHAAVRTWRDRGFFRALNRMLFLAGPASERHRVLGRFYRLPEDLIARFYAGRITFTDRVRVLTGIPPVPVLGAIRALLDGSVEPLETPRHTPTAPEGPR